MNKYYGLVKKCIPKYHMILLENEDNNLSYFIMTKGQFKSYRNHITNERNVYVSLSFSQEKKKFSNFEAFKVSSLDRIESFDKNTKNLLYINESSLEFISSCIDYDGYKLFIDFEFTMGDSSVKNFESEIIQVGMVVADKDDKIVYEYSNYIKTKNKVTNRCMRFLDLPDEVLSESISQIDFYKDFSEVIKIYNPIAFTWGGSDDVELKQFYKLNKFKPIDVKFYDLSELIKKYYKLPENVGLFRALKIFKDINVNQAHHALTDSAVTKDVFDCFKEDVHSSNSIDFVSKLAQVKAIEKAIRDEKKQLRKAEKGNKSKDTIEEE